MKNSKLLNLVLLPLLALTITSCGGDISASVSNSTPASDELSESVESSYSEREWSQEDDEYDLIPQHVLDAELEIDMLIAIDGQRDRLPDIGNTCWDETDPEYDSYRYHEKDIYHQEMLRHVGAASAFKKLAPGVKINLQFCQIANYNAMIQDYRDAKGHLPHIMHGTDHVVEYLGIGYCHDLSAYDNSEYYNMYNDYFMGRFNFGGFQAGIPYQVDPWGVFVKMDSLEDFSIVTDTIDNDIGECTDEYKEWVDNFTWENFADAVKKSNNETHAGLSRMKEWFLSYSLPTINDQFVSQGDVDLTSEEIVGTLKNLLEYENELSQYCVYNYGVDSFGAEGSLVAKPQFPNAAYWNAAKNFVDDQYATFQAENPWALAYYSQYVNAHNEQVKNDVTGTMKPLNPNIDFVPYPKVDDDSQAYTGIAVEGLLVGNQCPVGEDGREHCFSAQSKLEMEVAAYYAMFIGVDPRSIKSRSEAQSFYNGLLYTGEVGFPLTKRGAKFKWQEDDEYAHLEDPAENYDDNWQYQLALWFAVNNLYVTNDKPADVVNFSNIPYGLVKMLDSMYLLDGVGDDYVTCINYWNEPVNIPDGDGIKDIFDLWQARFWEFANEETNDGVLGTSSYVSNVLNQLAVMEEDINSTSAIAWSFLQESVDNYYFDENFQSLYNVLDRTERNNYEGSRFI